MTQSQVNPVWPPSYTIKKHRLAKSVKLKATRERGLLIIVPHRFNIKNIPDILENNKNWIIKHLAKLPLQTEKNNLPDKIIFAAMNISWDVKLISCDAKLEMIIKPNHEIVLTGKVSDERACKIKLMSWIKNQAKEYLNSQLEILSTATNLPYTNLTIRDQQTLWGSCTSKKNISLNYKLIFLPQALLQYVIIHELCHTRYLNHSEKFWNLVSMFDANWRQHRNELRHAKLPEWL